MLRVRKPPTRLLVAALVVLAVMLAAETVVLAYGTWTKNGGPVRAVYTVNSNDELWLYSPTLDDVPNMSVTVSVPGGQKALLVITFSAETWCQSSGSSAAWCQVLAVVDGTAAEPGGYSFDSSGDDWYEAHSMQWVALVAPGDHRVWIRYLVGPTSGTGTFVIGYRTLTVLQSKQGGDVTPLEDI